MKRIQDKIKDLVEPQSFEQVGNFADDPAQALAAYRFTDVTSDLLARWLDELASLPPGGGSARALAGARGVGKSHALAVFGAVAGSERLRASVYDSHVAASARRLSGRRFALVRVERGTRPTLAGELAAGFAAVFGGSEQQWGGRGAAEMLTVAASRATGETLVVVVDTAFNRPGRVARDDGPVLGELAEAACGLNVFLALALDDDIAGADGANVALAAAYRIDYLDPENLYRVADQFVLRKRPQVGDTLREIYRVLRDGVLDFNWSRERFAAVYPVHPLVAEVASGVRLFVPAFAFLPFAAGAAARATSRPALSLILLDEVFDETEAELRKSEELRGPFAAYDHLTERCIAQLPVMRRYQARLILKSLFVLSLDERGATPREMCAALLLTEEDGGADALRAVGETLAHFAESAAPGSFDLSDVAGGATRYRFHVASRDTPAAADALGTKEEAAGATKEEVTEASPARAHEAPAPALADALPAFEHPSQHQPPQNPPAQTQDHVALSNAAEETAAAGAVSSARPRVEHESSAVEAVPLPDEQVEWARLLTRGLSLGSAAGLSERGEVRAALALWLRHWNGRGLSEKFEALQGGSMTTRVWKARAEVEKSFGRAASALEDVFAGGSSLEDGLANIARAFRGSHEVFARRAGVAEDLSEFVEGAAERERVRAYLATAEATGVAEIETARRELLTMAEDQNNFLDAANRERFGRLWREFRTRYGEHYSSVHDKTVGSQEARESLRALRGGERWREFESLARLPVVSAQVWRQAEALVKLAEGGSCDLPVRRVLEGQPSCACRFRLSKAAELEELPQELEALMERGRDVYRRTLLMLGANLAISLDALARRAADDAEAQCARALSAAFAQGRLPERLTRQDVRLLERALQRMSAPPPVKVVAPNGDAGLLTREELRARFVQWLDELPEQPVLIEIVSKAEINAP